MRILWTYIGIITMGVVVMLGFLIWCWARAYNPRDEELWEKNDQSLRN